MVCSWCTKTTIFSVHKKIYILYTNECVKNQGKEATNKQS